TTSCYDPGANGQACGRCDACQLRLKGFSEAGIEDPIEYATPRERPLAGRAAR
ncbi:MAG TPA: 7-cyano-7-deazaguanine synthase, partial [Gemmatimonadaceae bacterium]